MLMYSNEFVFWYWGDFAYPACLPVNQHGYGKLTVSLGLKIKQLVNKNCKEVDCLHLCVESLDGRHAKAPILALQSPDLGPLVSELLWFIKGWSMGHQCLSTWLARVKNTTDHMFGLVPRHTLSLGNFRWVFPFPKSLSCVHIFPNIFQWFSH